LSADGSIGDAAGIGEFKFMPVPACRSDGKRINPGEDEQPEGIGQ